MAEPVYGIDDFPDDDSLWRVEWIGGVGYNTSVPSDPRITVCLTQLPPGETNPLSARARSWQTKTTAKISVGLLPYISIVSVWQRRRPVVTNLGACHHRLCIDTTATRDTVPKAKRALFSDIPSSGIFRVVDSYRFPEPMKSRAWSC